MLFPVLPINKKSDEKEIPENKRVLSSPLGVIFPFSLFASRCQARKQEIVLNATPFLFVCIFCRHLILIRSTSKIKKEKLMQRAT